jgi:TadE-like protein
MLWKALRQANYLLCNMQPKLKCRANERGTALVEFALVATLLVPLILGLAVIGLNLMRAIQVTEVCRDTGHMYSYGVDFSQSANQNLVVGLAAGLNMTANGGNGVIILSTVTYVDDCQGGGYGAPDACPNYGQMVFTNRLTIGNAGLRASGFGTPSAALMDGSGNIPAGNSSGTPGYLNDPTTVVSSSLTNLITLNQSGHFVYVTEMYTISPDFDLWTYLNMTSPSAVSIF